MILAKFMKQPREYKDYDIDYLPWLSVTDDTLDVVEVFVECLTDPDDNSLVCDDIYMTYTSVKLWMRGGVDDYDYKVTVLATSVLGLVDESELIFTIKDI